MPDARRLRYSDACVTKVHSLGPLLFTSEAHLERAGFDS